MNTSIENIVCVHRVYEKEGFWTTHVSCCISGARPSWQAKSVDPRVRQSGRRVMMGRSLSLVPYKCTDKFLVFREWKATLKSMLKMEPHITSNTINSSWKSHVTSRVDSCCWKPVCYQWPERYKHSTTAKKTERRHQSCHSVNQDGSFLCFSWMWEEDEKFRLLFVGLLVIWGSLFNVDVNVAFR